MSPTGVSSSVSLSPVAVRISRSTWTVREFSESASILKDILIPSSAHVADEMVLALLSLTISEENTWGARAWKSHDWDVLDRLHAKEVHLGPEEQGEVGEAESGGGEAGAGPL